MKDRRGLGVKGAKGDKGETGDDGDAGETGDTGTTRTIKAMTGAIEDQQDQTVTLGQCRTTRLPKESPAFLLGVGLTRPRRCPWASMGPQGLQGVAGVVCCGDTRRKRRRRRPR